MVCGQIAHHGQSGLHIQLLFRLSVWREQNAQWQLPGAHILEISGKDGSLLWEFVSPWSKDRIYKTSSGHGQNGAGIHRAMFYAPDYAGFKGKDLSSILYSVPNWVVLLNQNPVPRRWVPLTPLLPGRY